MTDFVKKFMGLFSHKRVRATKPRRLVEAEKEKAQQIKYFLRINSYPKGVWFRICVAFKEETNLSLLRIISLLLASPAVVVEDTDFDRLNSLQIKLTKLNCDTDILQSVVVGSIPRKDGRAA